MGLVTVYWPLTTTGAVELVLQTTKGTRLVVDSKVKPVAFVVHVKTTLVPAGVMFSCGADPKARLNTVPLPAVPLPEPPPSAVPYRVLPDKTKVPSGKAPSLPPEKL